MKIIDIPPKFLSDELALKICNNKKLKKKYIIKYKKNLFGGGDGDERFYSNPMTGMTGMAAPPPMRAPMGAPMGPPMGAPMDALDIYKKFWGDDVVVADDVEVDGSNDEYNILTYNKKICLEIKKKKILHKENLGIYLVYLKVTKNLKYYGVVGCTNIEEIRPFQYGSTILGKYAGKSIEKIYCSNCDQLKQISDFPIITELDCSNCPVLNIISGLPLISKINSAGSPR